MKTLSNNFRIKIDMSNVAINPSRVWLLVNPDACSNVKLLKKKIVDKFSLLYSSKQFDVVLQDFIIPDDESIEIIKCDDVISLRLRLSKSKPGSLINNENDDQAREVALPHDIVLDENHSEKRKKKKSAKLKAVQVQLTPTIEINTKKRKRKKLSMDEECGRTLNADVEVTEDILIDAQDSEYYNGAEESVTERSQVSAEVEIDYEAMFPLPKKRRRRHRKKSPVTTHANDDVMQNVVEKPFGSFSLKLRDYDDTEHVRRHLRFADDEDDKVRNESSKIDSIMENSESILAKKTFIVEETLPKQVVEDQPIDFTKFEPLLGPPRLNDHVCYQVLEISEDYSPQISSLRVGKVTSFDPNLNIVTVKFDKPIVTKPRKGKFELIDKIEDENYNEEEIEKEDEIILIENESCKLSEMIGLKVRV